MIDFIKLFFLGLLQGLSEFFPISSSGHLTVAQIFLKSETAFLFTVILHFGTLCSLLLFYRKTLFHILKTSTLPFQKNTFFKIITASLPIMSVGLFFYSKIKSFFDHTHTVGLGFIFTGLLLLGTYVSLKKHKLSRLSQYRDLSPTNIQMFNSISYIQALGIGILQSLALFSWSQSIGCQYSCRNIFRAITLYSSSF